jgi:MerR family glutamine synthetase transcriptional repressor
MPSRRKPARETPVYTISVASKLTTLPIYTIRWLEAQHLCTPARTEGRQRLFSEEDIEFLQEVADLLGHGVNLAGIRAILQIKKTYRLEQITITWEEI